jgi:hypothetical protein
MKRWFALSLAVAAGVAAGIAVPLMNEAGSTHRARINSARRAEWFQPVLPCPKGASCITLGVRFPSR